MGITPINDDPSVSFPFALLRRPTLTADLVHYQARTLPSSFQAPLLLSGREDVAFAAAIMAARSKLDSLE